MFIIKKLIMRIAAVGTSSSILQEKRAAIAIQIKNTLKTS